MVYNLSYQGKIDIQAKITNFIKVTGIIKSVFKPNLLQLHARLRVYNILAKPTLYYGSEAWTVKKQDGKQLEAAEMRFMRRTAEYRYNSGQEKKRTHFGRITSRTNHHLPTAIQSTMEITH
jgi:hypothetical protein